MESNKCTLYYSALLLNFEPTSLSIFIPHLTRPFRRPVRKGPDSVIFEVSESSSVESPEYLGVFHKAPAPITFPLRYFNHDLAPILVPNAY